MFVQGDCFTCSLDARFLTFMFYKMTPQIKMNADLAWKQMIGKFRFVSSLLAYHRLYNDFILNLMQFWRDYIPQKLSTLADNSADFEFWTHILFYYVFTNLVPPDPAHGQQHDNQFELNACKKGADKHVIPERKNILSHKSSPHKQGRRLTLTKVAQF